MKAILVIACLFVAGFASVASNEHMSNMWEAWKLQHGKTYSALDETARFGIFQHNFKKIQKFNEENDSPRMAVNKFADLTASEFKAQQASCAFTETNEQVIQENSKYYGYGALPASVDWRAKGAVTPVKNQGQCGSCWTFSTTGVLEGWNFIHNGQLLSFSEQQIVDCDTTTNEGCDGGWPYLAIEYAGQNGLELESDYPYTGQDGTCRYQSSKAHKVASNYTFVTPNSTDQLKSAIVDSPVSVLIEADQDVFQFYSSGIIKTGCGANLDHAVLAVGYHKVGTLEAFIVKNSWGTDWGEDGYVHIWDIQQVNNGQGVCGILAQPVVPK
jgi:C1A family cysteine protease